MKGFPPPAEKRVNRSNALMAPPFNRWSYLHMRTLYPTANIRSASAPVHLTKRIDGGVDLGSATIEVEIVDSISRKRLVAAVSQKGAEHFAETPEERREEVERIFREWAVALRVWIDEATGRQ